jgi:hypothetical protein
MTPFRPADGSTVSINVAATTANVQVSASTGVQQVRIMNNGTATVWIRFGTDNTVAATTSHMPVGPGTTEVLSHQGPLWVAAIAAGATGLIYFTPGEGI